MVLKFHKPVFSVKLLYSHDNEIIIFFPIFLVREIAPPKEKKEGKKIPLSNPGDRSQFSI
jgi:hypothetical protein